MPVAELAPFVAHFWSVSWSFKAGEVHRVETLPHPNVHVVFEPGASGVFGVTTGRFTKHLEAEGRAFGVKFRPGGFRPFYGAAVSRLANTSCSIESIFKRSRKTTRAILARDDFATQVKLATSLLLAQKPAQDRHVDWIASLVESIEGQRSCHSAAQLASQHGVTVRSLQRLFSQYVGASPRWVINRYRLHEAVQQLSPGASPRWAALALELGYCDQSHFIRDFKRLIGQTPAQYAAR